MANVEINRHFSISTQSLLEQSINSGWKRNSERWWKRKRRREGGGERLIERSIAGANRLASLKGPRLEMNGMTFKRGRVPPGIRHHRGSLPENESYFTVRAARDATGPSERGRRDADVREKVTKEATVLIIGVRAPYNADKGRRPGSAARDAIRRFCFFYPGSSSSRSRLIPVGSKPTLSAHANRSLSLSLSPPVFHAESFLPKFPKPLRSQNFLRRAEEEVEKAANEEKASRNTSRRGGFFSKFGRMMLACTMTSERRGIPPPLPFNLRVRLEFACQSPLPSNFLHAIARYWNCLVGDLSPSVIYFLNRACLPAYLPTYLPTSTCPADWLADWLAARLTDCRPLRHTT